jgi:hypothetical protein
VTFLSKGQKVCISICLFPATHVHLHHLYGDEHG